MIPSLGSGCKDFGTVSVDAEMMIVRVEKEVLRHVVVLSAFEGARSGDMVVILEMVVYGEIN